MKKAIAILLAAVMALSMVACSRNCKEEGCDKDVFKEGYCEIHYGLHQLEDGLKDLFN
jgi:hypothetical protein